ncbi:MAG: hypothetical protein U5N86_05270 [Planctomycetota bacterium]|nr:hypothetical protein [Planctomycetota bacterium]
MKKLLVTLLLAALVFSVVDVRAENGRMPENGSEMMQQILDFPGLNAKIKFRTALEPFHAGLVEFENGRFHIYRTGEGMMVERQTTYVSYVESVEFGNYHSRISFEEFGRAMSIYGSIAKDDFNRKLSFTMYQIAYTAKTGSLENYAAMLERFVGSRGPRPDRRSMWLYQKYFSQLLVYLADREAYDKVREKVGNLNAGRDLELTKSLAAFHDAIQENEKRLQKFSSELDLESIAEEWDLSISKLVERVLKREDRERPGPGRNEGNRNFEDRSR